MWAEQDIAGLTAEWQAADQAGAELSLNQVFVSDRWGEMSLRWAYGHMISECCRHNGHADMLRQRIYGSTGLTSRRRPGEQRRSRQLLTPS